MIRKKNKEHSPVFLAPTDVRHLLPYMYLPEFFCKLISYKTLIAKYCHQDVGLVNKIWNYVKIEVGGCGEKQEEMAIFLLYTCIF